MKTALVKLILLFLACLTFGRSNHLEPEPGIFSTYEVIHQYFAYTKYKLLKGTSNNPEVLLIFLPSFEPESAFLIESRDSDSTYILSYLCCEEQIWYSEDAEKIEIKKKQIEVSQNFVELINGLWALALAETKYPNEPTLGLDGETFIFLAPIRGGESGLGRGIRAGSIWSPSEGCLPYEIIELTRGIIESLNGDSFEEEEFIPRIAEITKKYE